MPAMQNTKGNNKTRGQGPGLRAQRMQAQVEARRVMAFVAITMLVLGFSVGLEAHGVSGKDAVFLQGLQGQAIGPLLYLGAKHIVTGYDHLLFLVGVIFFLYRLKDVLL